jgi:hypothetical protein
MCSEPRRFQIGCVIIAHDFGDPKERSEFTVLLRRWSDGSKAVLDRMTPIIYKELRRLAASRLRREREGHTLQPTTLIPKRIDAWSITTTNYLSGAL